MDNRQGDAVTMTGRATDLVARVHSIYDEQPNAIHPFVGDAFTDPRPADFRVLAVGINAPIDGAIEVIAKYGVACLYRAERDDQRWSRREVIGQTADLDAFVRRKGLSGCGLSLDARQRVADAKHDDKPFTENPPKQAAQNDVDGRDDEGADPGPERPPVPAVLG